MICSCGAFVLLPQLHRCPTNSFTVTALTTAPTTPPTVQTAVQAAPTTPPTVQTAAPFQLPQSSNRSVALRTQPRRFKREIKNLRSRFDTTPLNSLTPAQSAKLHAKPRNYREEVEERDFKSVVIHLTSSQLRRIHRMRIRIKSVGKIKLILLKVPHDKQHLIRDEIVGMDEDRCYVRADNINFLLEKLKLDFCLVDNYKLPVRFTNKKDFDKINLDITSGWEEMHIDAFKDKDDRDFIDMLNDVPPHERDQITEIMTGRRRQPSPVRSCDVAFSSFEHSP
jgi:hypothetical protein